MATRLDRRRRDAWTHFVLSYNEIMRVLEQEMTAGADLTLSQYDVLLRLSEAPEGRMKMSELADAIVYSTGGLTRLVERMCRAGLVARDQSTEDRRVVYAVMTDEGRRRLRVASKMHMDGVERHFARHLADDEVDAVDGFLARLHEASRRCDG
jgi:DNA-binding MarR family transcriptional regulator